MAVFNFRFIEILQILYEKSDYISSNQLATQLNISSKTISRTIKMYENNNYYIHNGFHIETKQGYGYTLRIDDDQLFEKFIEKYFSGDKNEAVNNEKREREISIIRLLLINDTRFITIQEIADELYVSEATISSDLKTVKHLLLRYGLKIINKASKGIRINGNEMSLRLGYSKYLASNIHCFDYDESDIDFVKDMILQTLATYQIQMSDSGREHLVSHILVSIHRMKAGHFITFDKTEIDQITNTREYAIAKAMINSLESRFIILNIEEESIYIAIQLLGKRSLSDPTQQYLLTGDVENMLIEIFDEIEKKLGISINTDEEVFNYLAMHFEPMLTRLKFGIKSNNPFVEEMKSQQPTSFEMGLIAKKVLLDNYNYVLDDDEVSYLAMYFSLALDRLKYLQKPKNILIVCGLGVCSSRILIYKLRQQYGKYINDILACQFHELRSISMKHFDGVISTINKPITTNLPVIYIDDFLNNLNDKALDSFFLDKHQEKFTIEKYLKKEHFFYADWMNNEGEAIDFILKGLTLDDQLVDELKENIMERERLSSTAFGNYCAIPHPIKMCSKETIFACLILNKSMLWGKKKVKCIFLLSPSKKFPEDLRYFNETLARFILDSKLFSKFFKTPDFETLYSSFSLLSNR